MRKYVTPIQTETQSTYLPVSNGIAPIYIDNKRYAWYLECKEPNIKCREKRRDMCCHLGDRANDEVFVVQMKVKKTNLTKERKILKMNAK